MRAVRDGIDDQRVRGGASAYRRLALSRREAADALGVSVDFLEEHVMHELRIVSRGRRRLIPVRELERWLDANAARAIDGVRGAWGEGPPDASGGAR
ncbi:MAG: helix-turn-helix domain-containing protein [Actinomycetota bacterium]|nr:helix-turn-helix domain-containing protein [Actinomycetota bacterium]